MTSTSNLVRYGSYTLEAATEDDAKVKAASGNSFMELIEGENVVRILPPPEGATSPFRVTSMHYIDPIPGSDRKIVFACPRVEGVGICPACAKAEELGRSPDPGQRERAKDLAHSLRIYANVLDRSQPDVGPKVLGFGKQIQMQLRAIRASPRLGGDFTDPTSKGFDIIITRTGTGRQDTKYNVAADRQCSPLADSDEGIVAILDLRHDLNALVDTVPPEELVAYFNSARSSLASGARPMGLAKPPAPSQMAAPAGPRLGSTVMQGAAQPVTNVSTAPNPLAPNYPRG